MKIPEGCEECKACEGKGLGYWSCCTGDPVDEDMPLCPKCKERLGEDTCEQCKGLGYVIKGEDNPKVHKVDLIGQAEAAVEAKKDWIAISYPSGPAWTGD